LGLFYAGEVGQGVPMRVVSFGHVAVFLALLYPTFTATPAAASRLTCRDGDPNIIISPRLSGPGFCNHDEPGDGVCTFAVCGPCAFIRNCVGPQSGVCPAGQPLPHEAEVITVPVKKKHVRRIGPTRVVFRCLAPVPCDAQHNCTPMTLTCEDGVAADRTCDFDQQVNGVCTFAFYCLERCGSAPRETVDVPVGESRVIQRPQLPRVGIVQLTLRCLPPS